MEVSVSVHTNESVLVTTVRDHTAVETVSVGVGAVMVSYSIPARTVMGGKVEYTVFEEKTVNVFVEVANTEVTVVLTAMLAVEVAVGTSGLRLATPREEAERFARWRSRREMAALGSTMRTSPRFQCKPHGKGIRVGMSVAHGSGKDGLGGTVQEGVTVSVTMPWVCFQRVKV